MLTAIYFKLCWVNFLQVLALNSAAGLINTSWFGAPQTCIDVFVYNNTLQCTLPILYGSLYSVYVFWTVPTKSSANEYRLAISTLDSVSARAPMTISSLVVAAVPGSLRRFLQVNGVRSIPPGFNAANAFSSLGSYFEPVPPAHPGCVIYFKF